MPVLESRATSSRRVAWLIALAAGAAALRLPGVLAGSMWLDEILETLQVRQPFPAALAALVADRVHPPLEPLLAWNLVHAGFGETARRSLAAGAGVLTVLLFARWLERRYGAGVAVVGGVLAAVSPALVAAAIELRPYPVALLMLVWSLDATERWLAQPGRRGWETGLALAGTALAHYLAGAVAVGAFLWRATAEPKPTLERQSGRRAAWRLAALALVPLVIWLVVLALTPTAKADVVAGPKPWSGAAVGARWQALTAGGDAAAALGVGGVVWALAVVLGILLGALRAGLGTLVVGALVGTAFVEGALALAGHWSRPRYDVFGVPFLIALAVLGVDALARTTAAAKARIGLTTVLLALPLAAATGAGWLKDWQRGRPDWRALAEAVRELGPGEPVLAANRWTRNSLGYYLGQFDPGGAETVLSLEGSQLRLEQQLRLAAGACRTVVVAGWPPSPELAGELRGIRPRLRAPVTDRAQLFRLRLDGTAVRSCAPGVGAR